MRLHIEITEKCNLKCTYCFNSNFDSTKILDTSDWIEIIKEANTLGYDKFSVSGGEPLLAQNFYKILSHCRGPITLFTNALLITPKNIEKLKKLKNLTACRISLDGLKSHDKYRIPSKSKEVIKKVKLLKKETNLSIGITTQFSKELADELLGFYDILKKLGIDQWRIDVPLLIGRYAKDNQADTQADFKEIVLACKKMIIKYKKDRMPFLLSIANIYSSIIPISNDLPDLNNHPHCRGDVTAIKFNGDTYICSIYPLPIGNMKQHGSLAKTLKQLDNQEFKHEFYKMKIKDMKNCMNCRYLNLCLTGCRAEAALLTGSRINVNPVACSMWRLLEEHIFSLYTKEQQKYFKKLMIDGKYPKTFKNLSEIIKYYETKNTNR